MSRRKKTNKESQQLKGVRMRKWGRWVSEIRVPKTRTRIWLGSYDTVDKAARAYDAAVYCLHGADGRFNFPGGKRPEIDEEERRALTEEQIKEIAARLAVVVPTSSDGRSGEVIRAEVAPAAGNASSNDVMDGCDDVGVEFSFDDFLFGEETMRDLWDLL